MPIIFEPPPTLLAAQAAGSLGSPGDGSGVAPTGDPQVWIAASGSARNWGGCNIHLSFDNLTYGPIGSIRRAANQGVLTAALPGFGGANPDIGNTLAADLAMSGGALPTGTHADAAAGRVTLCYVDGELIAYGLATPTAGNAYDLTYLYRALFGSCGGVHASGAPFVLLDGAVFKYNLPAAYIGQTLYFKFQSFNAYGLGLQDLSSLAPVAYAAVGTGDGFSNSPFMSLPWNGATISLGRLSGPTGNTFSLGLLSGCAGQTIELGTIG